MSYRPNDWQGTARRAYEGGYEDGKRDALADGERVESVGVTFADMPEGYDGLILAVPSRAWSGSGRSYVLIPISEAP